MLLYIVRHAFAGEHGDPRYPDDRLRPLTKKGRKRFDRLVKTLVCGKFAPTSIGTSPLVRCRQTADVLADRLPRSTELQVVDSFAPGCGTADVLSWAAQLRVDQAAYVGHAPDVDTIAAALVGAEAGAIRFAKGAIAAIDFDSEPAIGEGTLLWLVKPKLISS